MKDVLTALEKILRDQWLMITLEHLPGALDADEADIEGVVEHHVDAFARNPAAGMIAKAEAKEFILEGWDAELHRGVKLESLPDQKPLHRINRFRFCGTV